MKAYQIDNYGGAEQLQLRELPSVVPGTGQVVLRVHATTLNPIDQLLASGIAREQMPVKFPWTPGADFSGVVEKIGDGVTDVTVGDEVFGFAKNGGSYAEQIAIDATAVGAKPQSLSHAEAASLGLVGQTALQSLHAADLQSGQTILIHGAAGAVGSIAVQLAVSIGAKVIATGASKSQAYIKSLGADQVIDYQTTPFELVVKGVDAVLDTIGKDTQERSFLVLKPGGILVALNQPPSQDLANQYKVRTVMLDTLSKTEDLKYLAEKVEATELKTNVGKIYGLSEIPRVWQEQHSLHVDGKIAFTV